ncbi:zinc finger FYVE domain-containing protein 1-like [Anneissia japonica]|uniref:zinc finger FYVE domain-containing protein 1-like n=1 Tax=Anneissia japonica TaxID=1529436 RepID=UPI001425B531|nr:zinc finger FYVE domain-containing protein 1-like [Anneissia japonica]XP_033125855.1 zinc finger FYVE domain-containing protein 1-like [Anneissia japonica]
MADKFKVSDTRAASKRICEEKFVCSGGEARFWCENCGSRQCCHCERQLHLQPKFQFHDREEIIQNQYTVGTEVCQKWCNPYNAASVKCEECKSVFCEECNKGYHIGKLSKHHRKLIPKPEPLAAAENLLLFSDPDDDDIQQIPDDCSDNFQTGIDFEEPQALSSLPNLELLPPTDDFTSFPDPFSIKYSPGVGLSTATSNLLDCKTSLNSLKSGSEELGLGLDMTQNRQAAVVQPNSHLSSMDEIETALLGLDIGNMDHFVEPGGRPIPRPRAKSACGADAAPKNGESDQAALLALPKHTARPGFLLVNGDEKLQVKSEAELLEKLGCNEDIKIVSIFGNTGDGKSHTLNHTFFNGQEVFTTSQLQESCTVGVWAAYDDNLKVVTVDTEGLLGVSPNENQRTRLLLKVMAISDIVIYRTRADRLHSDLFRFIGDASLAYRKHFDKELTITADRIGEDISLSTIGPVVIVFQETQHTDILGFGCEKSADVLLRERFEKMKLNMRAFSSIHYVGTRTDKPPTNFKILRDRLKEHIKDNTVRSPRPVSVMFAALKVLNEKFSGEIETTQPKTFPDEYFTCTSRCLACQKRCTKTMNHKDKLGHETDGRCKYLHQHDNRVYICKACLEKGGEEVVVVPKTSSCNDSSWVGLAKYAWSGYVLECPNCGIIYRSRQYWYGNQDPVDAAVRTEIRHVWPGGHMVLQGTTDNTSRKVIDGLSYLIDTVSSVSKKPTSMISDWISDQIAPPYWIPNSQIVECNKCGIRFENDEKKHHCRACGNGFCDDCSDQRLPVPEKGWGEAPVRVCKDCFETRSEQALAVQEGGLDQPPVMARKVGEAFQNTLGMVANVMVYPKDYLLDVARPVYWVPDEDIISCNCCKKEFTPKIRKHHCRACGQGVCSDCSKHTKPVPSRGWDQPVRVCNDCNEKETL